MKELTNNEMQNVELTILKKVAAICEKHNWQYFLAYGTLLGAIRHNGFIPWDDDVDIMMKRSDYDQLVNYFIKHEKELYPLKIFSRKNNKEYPYMISRICDIRYKYVANNEDDCGMGLFIDIYPLDGAGKSWKDVKRMGNVFQLTSSMCFLSTRKKFFVDHVEYSSKRSIKMTLIKFPLYVISKLLGKEFFFRRLDKFKEKYRYEDCYYVGPTTWQSDYHRDVMKKEYVDKTILHKFEDGEFRIPVYYHEILTQKYGDYMKLPPKDKQVATHNYKAYKK